VNSDERVSWMALSGFLLLLILANARPALVEALADLVFGAAMLVVVSVFGGIVVMGVIAAWACLTGRRES